MGPNQGRKWLLLDAREWVTVSHMNLVCESHRMGSTPREGNGWPPPGVLMDKIFSVRPAGIKWRYFHVIIIYLCKMNCAVLKIYYFNVKNTEKHTLITLAP